MKTSKLSILRIGFICIAAVCLALLLAGTSFALSSNDTAKEESTSTSADNISSKSADSTTQKSTDNAQSNDSASLDSSKVVANSTDTKSVELSNNNTETTSNNVVQNESVPNGTVTASDCVVNKNVNLTPGWSQSYDSGNTYILQGFKKSFWDTNPTEIVINQATWDGLKTAGTEPASIWLSSTDEYGTTDYTRLQKITKITISGTPTDESFGGGSSAGLDTNYSTGIWLDEIDASNNYTLCNLTSLDLSSFSTTTEKRCGSNLVLGRQCYSEDGSTYNGNNWPSWLRSYQYFDYSAGEWKNYFRKYTGPTSLTSLSLPSTGIFRNMIIYGDAVCSWPGVYSMGSCSINVTKRVPLTSIDLSSCLKNDDTEGTVGCYRILTIMFTNIGDITLTDNQLSTSSGSFWDGYAVSGFINLTCNKIKGELLYKLYNVFQTFDPGHKEAWDFYWATGSEFNGYQLGLQELSGDDQTISTTDTSFEIDIPAPYKSGSTSLFSLKLVDSASTETTISSDKISVDASKSSNTNTHLKVTDTISTSGSYTLKASYAGLSMSNWAAEYQRSPSVAYPLLMSSVPDAFYTCGLTVASAPKVTLDANGGTPGSVTAIYPEKGSAMPALTTAGNLPTRTGYTFSGYFDGASAGTQYYNADGTSKTNWDKDTTATLYAHWKANEYSITYKDQGDATFSGTHASTYPKTHTYGTATTLDTPTKTGYTFGGYFTDKDCTGTAVASLGATDYTAAITLYAKWTINHYSVFFDVQGHGTAPTAIDSQNYGTTITKPTDPTATGYTFGGWYKEAACTNAWDFTNDTMPDKALILYAKWTVNHYSVTFDVQGHGTAPSTISSQNYGTTITKPTDPTATGYTFGGWYKEAACTNAWDFATDTMPNNALTLYAKWTISHYSVTFDVQGHGTAPTTIESQNYGTTITKPTDPTATGYTFGGWYKEAACTNAWDFTNDTMPDKALILYAKWTVNHYSVTFDVQGHGTAPSTISSQNYGTTITKPTDPTATGYTFGGWYKEAACTNAWDFATDTMPNNALTLYAKWTVKTYTVTLDANEGIEGSKTSVSATYGLAMPALTSEGDLPYRIGYTFTGYYDGKTDGVKYYDANGNSVRNWDKDVTNAVLYAQWTANEYSVTLNLNDGSGKTVTVSPVFGEDMPALSKSDIPSKDGYTFEGYYYDVEETSSISALMASIAFADDDSTSIKYYNADGTSAHVWNIPFDEVTLNAHWTANPSPSPTPDNNNGSAATSSVSSAQTGDYTFGFIGLFGLVAVLAVSSVVVIKKRD